MKSKSSYFQVRVITDKEINNFPVSFSTELFFGDSTLFYNQMEELDYYLYETEKEKVNRFKFIEDKMSYAVCHALLKRNVQKRLCRSDLTFDFFCDKKPNITGMDMDFNISHSSNMFCFVFTTNEKIKVGIDIELVKPVPDINSFVEMHFSHLEQDLIFRYDDKKLQLEKFYEIWTRKEAFLKMLGVGLNAELEKISLSEPLNFIDAALPLGNNDNVNNAFIITLNKGFFIMSVCLSKELAPQFFEITKLDYS